MSIRLSDAATFLVSGDAGIRRVFNGMHITFYTGAQPTSANDGIGSSQPIISFTESDQVFTPQKNAMWKITFSSVTGTVAVQSIKMGDLEILCNEVSATSAESLASLLSAEINLCVSNCGYSATSSGGDVFIYAPISVGSRLNGLRAVVTFTGSMTVVHGDSGHLGLPTSLGVDPVGGLSFARPVDGNNLSPAENCYYLEKTIGENWLGKNGFGPATAAQTALFSGITNGQTYSAGWGRICLSDGDTGFDFTSGDNGYVRLDFSVGTSGADCIMLPSTSFLINTTVGSEIESTISKFILKIPKNMRIGDY